MGKRRIKVMLLITELAYGGTPRVVQRLAEGLDPGRFEATVTSLLPKRDIAWELEEKGFRVHSLGIESKLSLKAVWDLKRLLWEEKVDLLHAFNYHANLIGRLVGRLLSRVPVVIVSERSVESEKRRRRVLIDRLTFQLADCWSVNAQAVKEQLTKRERVDPTRIRVISSGVDLKAFSPRDPSPDWLQRLGIHPGDFTLVSVGRLDPYKGQEDLLQALSRLQGLGKGRRLKLILVGDGRFREKLQQMATSLGLADSVSFVGAIPHVAEALACADLFALPSTEEGLPGAVLEAMAMAKPVVATAVGGTPEAVKDGITGILVPSRDPEALAKAIEALLQDPDQARAMGQAGRRRIEEHFPVERMVAETEQLYEELIRDKLSLRFLEGKWQPIW